MNLILFDDAERSRLLPLAWTRPVADFRFGILTIREKWERRLETVSSTHTESYLQEKYPLRTNDTDENIWINGRVCPTDALIAAVRALEPMQVLFHDEILVAANTGNSADAGLLFDSERFTSEMTAVRTEENFLRIDRLWDIFNKNGSAIAEDFALLTAGRTSAPLSKTNTVIGNNPVFLEAGAKAEACIFNTTNGPIYIAADAELMEGCMFRGPVAIGEQALIKMGAKIYGATTIGPGCRAGGELNNVMMFANSNKSHDGYLGNSVVGEWCNLGADTNCSNLKNNYGPVKLWSYALEMSENTGLQFCGLVMADHSKCSINTMFNTGTVVGVCANIFGTGFPPVFIPDFSWGGSEGFSTYQLDKAFETMERVLARRHQALGDEDRRMLQAVFRLTEAQREAGLVS